MLLTSGPRRLIAICFILTAVSGVLWGRGAGEKDGVLTVGAVQFAVSEEVYATGEAFRTAMDASLDAAEAEAAARGRFLDLAVFPEYTSAFLGLSVLSDSQASAIAASPAENRHLIADALERTYGTMMEIWTDVSRERGYPILAGSTLMVDSDGRIRNRALLFDRNGELIWSQDKVFPGAPEEVILNLQTGEVSDAEAFVIDGFPVVTTICRDTYHEEWETALPEARLWIDIKANELPWTQEYYDGALASRLPDSPIDRGLTVSLSGGILGFRFTGPTEYLYDMGPIAGTDPWQENAVLVIEIPEDVKAESDL